MLLMYLDLVNIYFLIEIITFSLVLDFSLLIGEYVSDGFRI